MWKDYSQASQLQAALNLGKSRFFPIQNTQTDKGRIVFQAKTALKSILGKTGDRTIDLTIVQNPFQ